MLYVILLISFMIVSVLVDLVVSYCLPKKVNIYTYNGILHAYQDVWFYNGDGGDSYPDVYAKGRNIVELYFNIIFNELRWVLFYKWTYRIMMSLSNNTKAWWYNQLLQTECDTFISIANVIDGNINWADVDYKIFTEIDGVVW